MTKQDFSELSAAATILLIIGLILLAICVKLFQPTTPSSAQVQPMSNEDYNHYVNRLQDKGLPPSEARKVADVLKVIKYENDKKDANRR